MITTEHFDDHDAWLSCCSSFENKTDFSKFSKSDIRDWKNASLLSFLAYHENETLLKIKNSTEKEINDENWLEKNATWYAVFLGKITIKSQNEIFKDTRKLFYKKGKFICKNTSCSHFLIWPDSFYCLMLMQSIFNIGHLLNLVSF